LPRAWMAMSRNPSERANSSLLSKRSWLTNPSQNLPRSQNFCCYESGAKLSCPSRLSANLSPTVRSVVQFWYNFRPLLKTSTFSWLFLCNFWRRGWDSHPHHVFRIRNLFILGHARNAENVIWPRCGYTEVTRSYACSLCVLKLSNILWRPSCCV